MEKALLLSIRPKHVASIFDGSKTVELRRTRPRVYSGDLVLIYASSPMKAVVGGFRVNELLGGALASLWTEVAGAAGITRTEFDAYFDGAMVGYGLGVASPWCMRNPIHLEAIRRRWPRFRPPQSYRYLNPEEALSSFLIKSAHSQFGLRAAGR